MLVLMTASYIEVSMKILIHALYATHAGIRSLEMIQATLRGMRVKKRVPAKVMWYFHLIPRLKCLFMNKTNAKLMRWHKEERKQDNILRHPVDGSQWNIRFGLSTDGMNPFGEQSSGHSTWLVTLCIYNIPP